MKKPILFNTEMVKAILNGTKSQTRRIVKIQPDDEYYYQTRLKDGVLTIDYSNGDDNPTIRCPYGNVGDELWVKETFSQKDDIIIYRANVCSKHDLPDGYKWKPSLFMPYSLHRINLTIKNIRVEHLKDISEVDAKAEGIEVIQRPKAKKMYRDYFRKGTMIGKESAIQSYKTLWDSINKQYYFEMNPLVWVIEFEISKPK